MTQLEKAIAILKKGGTVIFPTDTVWGLAVDATNEKAVDRVYHLKSRTPSRRIFINTSWEKLDNLVEIPEAVRPILEKHWPGPLTAILKAKYPSSISKHLFLNETLAVRIPNHPVTLALLQALPFPITSTSANEAGKVPPKCRAEVQITADFIFDDPSVSSGISSSLIDFTKDPFEVIRAGETKL